MSNNIIEGWPLIYDVVCPCECEMIVKTNNGLWCIECKGYPAPGPFFDKSLCLKKNKLFEPFPYQLDMKSQPSSNEHIPVIYNGWSFSNYMKCICGEPVLILDFNYWCIDCQGEPPLKDKKKGDIEQEIEDEFIDCDFRR